MKYNAIEDFIRKSPHTAIYFEDKVISYDELYNNVNRYANKLKETMKPNDEIMIILDDCPEYFYLFWGAIKAGIRPMLLSTMLRKEDEKSIIIKHDPKSVFTNNNIEHFDNSATDETDFEPYGAERNDVCFYLFSSGTTGYIKRIPHKHKDLAPTAINYAKKTLYMNAYDVTYSSAKLFFAYGLGNSMTFPLFVGASTVLVKETSTAKSTLDAIEKYKPTIYFGVPTLYAHQLSAMKNRKRDLTSLRMCVSAGESLPAPIYNKWKDAVGVTIFDGIGTTEALHIFISNRHEYSEAGCSGRIVPGYKAQIVDDNGEMVPDGEVGYLQIQGDSLAEDGWFMTGDMFVKDKAKYYYKGRSNDMIKIGGIWVSPIDIESKIMEHNNVLECAVVTALDHNELTKIKAFVVTKVDIDSTKNEVKKLCIDELPVNHYPHYVDIVNELPKTPTGKIQRYKLRQTSLQLQ